MRRTFKAKPRNRAAVALLAATSSLTVLIGVAFPTVAGA